MVYEFPPLNLRVFFLAVVKRDWESANLVVFEKGSPPSRVELAEGLSGVYSRVVYSRNYFLSSAIYIFTVICDS
jgi:hypothetical protein